MKEDGFIPCPTDLSAPERARPVPAHLLAFPPDQAASRLGASPPSGEGGERPPQRGHSGQRVHRICGGGLRALKARGGFTLIEALATLTLVAIVLPVALQCIAISVNAGSDAARRLEAIVLAQSKLDELVATGGWEESKLEGDFREALSGYRFPASAQDTAAPYRWSATVNDWLDSTVKELTVTVAWESRSRMREVALTTLVRAEAAVEEE